jgi:hypothetical protein
VKVDTHAQFMSRADYEAMTVHVESKPVDVLDLPANEKTAINGGNAAKAFKLQ